MASSQNLGLLKAEISAAIDVLEPQIDGLGDLYVIHFSDAVKREISDNLARHTRRLGLCQVALEALEALEAGGFPEMAPVQISSTELKELSDEVTALEAAISGFVGTQASRIEGELGNPVDK